MGQPERLQRAPRLPPRRRLSVYVERAWARQGVGTRLLSASSRSRARSATTRWCGHLSHQRGGVRLYERLASAASACTTSRACSTANGWTRSSWRSALVPARARARRGRSPRARALPTRAHPARRAPYRVPPKSPTGTALATVHKRVAHGACRRLSRSSPFHRTRPGPPRWPRERRARRHPHRDDN